MVSSDEVGIVCPATFEWAPLSALGFSFSDVGTLRMVHCRFSPCPACGGTHRYGNTGDPGDIQLQARPQPKLLRGLGRLRRI